MKPAPFEYRCARSSEEAVSLLADGDGYNAVLAGGQTLLPLLNLRLVQPDCVVDISRIESMTGCRDESSEVVFGATCTHAAFEDNRFADPSNGLLRGVAGGIAYRSIRNRGTLGGSLAYADPAAEWPVVMVALEAVMEVLGPDGSRSIPAHEFVSGAMTTSLNEQELLEAVRIPKLSSGVRWGFRKLARKPGDFAQALAVVVGGDVPRVVIGATTRGPLLLPGVAAYLTDRKDLFATDQTDLAAAFAEDLSVAGVALDPYEEQIHRHTLSLAVQDLFAA